MRWKQVVVGAALALAVFAPAQQALAHAGLDASVPSANAVLETGPPNIELDFNEAIDAELANIELYDQNATLIPTGMPQSASPTTRSCRRPCRRSATACTSWCGAFRLPTGTSSTEHSASRSARLNRVSMSVR